MREQYSKKRNYIVVLGNFVLSILALTLALGLMEMMMRMFPNWVPPEVRVNPPSRRMKALIDETYDLRLSDGDLFHYMRGKVAPLSPEQDQVVAHIHMVTDANGFRNSLPEQATYEIVALGDSFTRASGVASPWPQLLAEQTGSNVFNLADVGFGPQDELTMLKQYGLNKHPQWVVLAFFGGNDLYDAGSYEQANPFILLRFGRYIFDQGIEAWNQRTSVEASTQIASNYRYPIKVTINNNDLDMAFFSYYFSWLPVNRQVIVSSRNYLLVQETILQMQKLSDAAGARFLLVYIPSKEHVYLPSVSDADTLKRIFADVPSVGLDEAGFLQLTNERTTSTLALQHMNDQTDLLADFAVEQKILYLDLTPTFQKEAGMGRELYYPFDTHWNQNGHDLAAQTIASYIANISSLPSYVREEQHQD